MAEQLQLVTSIGELAQALQQAEKTAVGMGQTLHAQTNDARTIADLAKQTLETLRQEAEARRQSAEASRTAKQAATDAKTTAAERLAIEERTARLLKEQAADQERSRKLNEHFLSEAKQRRNMLSGAGIHDEEMQRWRDFRPGAGGGPVDAGVGTDMRRMLSSVPGGGLVAEMGAGPVGLLIGAIAGLKEVIESQKAFFERQGEAVKKETATRTSVYDAARRAGIENAAGVSEFASTIRGSVTGDELATFAGQTQQRSGTLSEADMRTALEARGKLGRRGGPATASSLASMVSLYKGRGMTADQLAARADAYTAQAGNELGDQEADRLEQLIKAGMSPEQALGISAAARRSGAKGGIQPLITNLAATGGNYQAALAMTGAQLPIFRKIAADSAGYQSVFEGADRLGATRDPFAASQERVDADLRDKEVAEGRLAESSRGQVEGRSRRDASVARGRALRDQAYSSSGAWGKAAQWGWGAIAGTIDTFVPGTPMADITASTYDRENPVREQPLSAPR
jgi:hypothetical protein